MRSFCIGSESPRSRRPPSARPPAVREFQRLVDQLAQVRDVDGLAHEIEGAELQGKDRRLDVAVCRDYGDRQFGRLRLDPFDEFRAVAIRQAQVREAKGVVLLALQFAPGGGEVVDGI